MWFSEKKEIINLGLKPFSASINEKGAKALDIDWQPPASGDIDAGLIVSKMINDPDVIAANDKAYNKYLSAQPILTEVAIAKDVIPEMSKKTITHAGPPILWGDMCGPMQGAMIGACLFEGWAKTKEEAIKLLEGGEIEYRPCHSVNAVGPMAGIISPSMPLWVVIDKETGNKTFSNMNEGLGKVLRFGAFSDDVIKRLNWMRDVLAPSLKDALKIVGQIELKPLMAQALHMGDEVHNRNAAATSLLLKKIIPALLKTDTSNNLKIEVVNFLIDNDHTFLNVSMAACKSMLDRARNIKNSTFVTAMARNGVKFGIQVSGASDQWFIADALDVDGLYFSSYDASDAAKDLGDSAITETAGVGGFAMATAPAIVQFVGGTPEDAIHRTKTMEKITFGSNFAFTLPALNFNGTPAGIDVIKVLDTNILPVINTGIAHKDAGIGQIGAGITNAPIDCFIEAIKYIDKNK